MVAVSNNLTVVADKLAAIRKLMQQYQLDYYLVPTNDQYNNEYLAAASQRLAWLTGFTGSNGLGVIGQEQLWLITDGRYLLQAEQQLAAALSETQFQIIDQQQQKLADLVADKVVGIDPKLHITRQVKHWQEKLSLQPVTENLVDLCWQERPQTVQAAIFDYQVGGTTAQKCQQLAKLLPAAVESLLITDLPSVSWLLNQRSCQIEHYPVVVTMLLVIPPRGVYQFTTIEQLAEIIKQQQLTNIALDPKQTNYQLWQFLSAQLEVIEHSNPILPLKAIKNKAEFASFCRIHWQDGAAIINCFSWLSEQLAAGKKVRETELVAKLRSFREQQPDFIEESFATIAGSDASGAIIHYKPEPGQDRYITANSMLLLDSGGHYYGGTTDVTRSYKFGEVTAELKQDFTAVLQGHLDLAMVSFGPETTSSELDALARKYLQAIGKDYAHSTGHGVGNVLSVHEYPPVIATKFEEPLAPGMIVSNEPGYYQQGDYGIRTENLQYVQADSLGKNYYFYTLTKLPYQAKLIDFEQLTQAQKIWLQQYHQQLLKGYQNLLEPPASNWLKQECEAMLAGLS